jgi:TonB family protein
MILLIESTIKVSLVVLFGLALAAMFKSRSAASRHWILAAAMLGAAITPFLQPIAPSWSVQVNLPSAAPPTLQSQRSGDTPAAGAPQTTSGQTSPTNASAGAWPLWRRLWDPALAGSIWLAGAVISLLVLALGFVRLAWIAAHSERIVYGKWACLAWQLSRAHGLKRSVRLLQSDHPSLLVTWGVRRPWIILPDGARTWSPDRMRIVLLHELAHIRRGDWVTQLAAEFLRAVYWFNPLLWIASRRLRQESEQACDDAVLNGGVEGSEYATHLLALARSITAQRRPAFTGFPAPAMARPSSLERRFRAMLNARLNRTPVTRPARATTTLAIVAVTLLIAGVGAAQTFSMFSGSVLDSTNRAIPKITLTLISVERQAKYSIQSDDNGRFEFVGLPAGDYQFEASAPGFATLKGTVSVDGRNVQRDLALEIGSLEETISIYGSRSTQPSAPRSYQNVQTRGNHDPGPCTVSAVGGKINPPRKVADVRPVYPAHLSAAGVGGVVKLEAVIGGDGYVSDVRVVNSPNADLDAAAIEAVRQWEFSSTLLNCQPVDVRMRVTANFVVQ